MTEGRLNRLLRHLHLLARRDIHLSQDGRVLGGVIDQTIEDLREQASLVHDRLLDGFRLTALEVEFLRYCQSLVDGQRSLLRQLEREFA